MIEQMERLARTDRWSIDLYSQRVSQLNGLRDASAPSTNSDGSIVWHRVSDIPGPHLLKYLWWFLANHWSRWRDRRSGRVYPDLLYSPGINCFDADVIVVHIVFHGFYDRVRSELALSDNSIRSWPLLIHRRLYYRLLMFLERIVYGDPATRLIAVSGFVSAQLKSYFQRADVTVIPNAVDTSRFNADTRNAKRSISRKSFGFEDGIFVLLLIGNDWKKKGLDTLLRALASLTAFPLCALIVGNDDVRAYDALLGRLCLPDRIRFAKPSSDVLSFYAAADLYVAPSLEDAFNLPVLEAMACALPVIASSQAGASELIRDEETGFILREPRDDVHLANLIRRIFLDASLRRAIGEAAARDVSANCTWDENAAKTKEILESSLQKLHGMRS
jgi:glycosyltransferase involved in cell wall biosynthesis